MGIGGNQTRTNASRAGVEAVCVQYRDLVEAVCEYYPWITSAHFY